MNIDEITREDCREGKDCKTDKLCSECHQQVTCLQDIGKLDEWAKEQDEKDEFSSCNMDGKMVE